MKDLHTTVDDSQQVTTPSDHTGGTLRRIRHDLRGSLNVISLHTSLLRRTVSGEREVAWLDEISAEVRRMEQAVDALRTGPTAPHDGASGDRESR
jgi:light-regulated signal transduction histidine kinase (bacteriophytochrome)